MKVTIATPTLDGNLTLEYVTSLLQTQHLCEAEGIEIIFSALRGDCFIDKARNSLVDKFMNSDSDQLFFIDADQGWNPSAFVRMVKSKPEIVAGAVPKKNDELVFNNPEFVTDENKNCQIEEGLLKATQVGTGFMRIKRSALERLLKEYPERYNPGILDSQETLPRIFETKVIDGVFWGEDLVFCKKWQALGEFIWIDPNIDFKHVGRKVFQGNFLSYLQENCSITTERK